MSLPYLQPYLGLSNGLNTLHAAGGAGGGIGGWVELARTTLGSPSSTIDISSIPDKRYYMLLTNGHPNGQYRVRFSVGNGSIDTGSNYSHRRSNDGGADGAFTSDTTWSDTDYTGETFVVSYIANYASKEKLAIHHFVEDQNTTGAGTAPGRTESYAKWANTSNVIDTIQVNEDGSGNFNTGSECVVLGWDPADTHTNNFWEELASVTLGGAGGSLSSGVFTSKKYIWCQYFTKGSTGDVSLRVGNTTVDSGSNYAGRTSFNGGADSTDTSQTAIQNMVSYNDIWNFGNIFIINNASNEKLMYFHIVAQGSAAGAANAPARRESVWKWTNTSNQIDIISLIANSGNVGAGSILKVWGAN